VAARVSAQAPAAPPPDAAKIPLSKNPPRAPRSKLDDFLENHPREAELTVTDFRQNSPGDGTACNGVQYRLSLLRRQESVRGLCLPRRSPARFARIFRNAKLPIRTTAWASSWTPTATFTAPTIFFSNPLGVQTDAIYTEGQGYDYSFDTLWANAGRVLNDGYIVSFPSPSRACGFRTRRSKPGEWPFIA